MVERAGLTGRYCYETEADAQVALSYAEGLGYNGEVSSSKGHWILTITGKEDQNGLLVLEKVWNQKQGISRSEENPEDGQKSAGQDLRQTQSRCVCRVKTRGGRGQWLN